MNITVKRIDDTDFGYAKQIRIKVFCDEQGYAHENEFDEYDETAAQFLAFDDEKAVATARIIDEGGGKYKIGRIAVLKEYRGCGVGKILVQQLIDSAKDMGAKTIIVDSQLRATGFYRTLGFESFGEEHPDGHVMHKYMRLNVK